MERKLTIVGGLTELGYNEQLGINGGSADVAPTPQTSFWNDLGYLCGVVTKGFVVFGTEGGRNAGLVVR